MSSWGDVGLSEPFVSLEVLHVIPTMGGEGSNPPTPSETPQPTSPTTKKPFVGLFEKSNDAPPPTTVIFPSSTHKDEPALKIPKSVVESMSKPFRFTLICTFSHGRPWMKRSRSIFLRLGLKGGFFLGYLDPKHMLQ